mmetsp:Transcript_58395/g.173994  ORF Transcript_58395/g.173994 Transcript_58395/m.173994 type:complete len:516 (-) Transcript_58395:474-2021(-)
MTCLNSKGKINDAVIRRISRSRRDIPSRGGIITAITALAITNLLCHIISCSAFLLPNAELVRRGVPTRVPKRNGRERKGALCELIKYGAEVSTGDGPVHTLLDNAGSMMSHSSLSELPHLHLPGIGRPRKRFLVGNISSSLRNIGTLARPALARLLDVVDPLDLTFLLSLAFGTEFVFRAYNNRFLNKTIRRNNPKLYETSKLCFIGRIVCQFGQCSLAAYLLEIVIAFLDAIGLHLPLSAPRAVAISIYAVWAAKKICIIKGRLIRRFFTRLARKGGGRQASSKGVFIDRLADTLIYLISGLVVLDVCRVQVGVVVKSLLSVAGLSSVVLGLSLRDPATQILQGTSLLLLDRFGPGDKIRLADGTIGRVMDIGWLDTKIMGSDDICARIPNSEIASRRIYNISRMKQSQVKQNLRFNYADIEKIPNVIEDIKGEIIESCPKLVRDGSRPFRVIWRGYADDHLEVVVNAHFNITPRTNEYYETVQMVMVAIARAAKKNGVQFALPSRIHLKASEA